MSSSLPTLSLQVFRRFGLEQFDPSGSAFDPNLHNAMLQIDDPTKEPGTVAFVLKVSREVMTYGTELTPVLLCLTSAEDASGTGLVYYSAQCSVIGSSVIPLPLGC